MSGETAVGTPDMSGVQYVEVSVDRAGQRLDNFLLGQLKGLPRPHVYRILRTGEVRVNGRRAKPDYRIQAGDRVRLPPLQRAATTEPIAPPPGLMGEIAGRILYEDDHLLAVNKPAGLAVHAGTGVAYGLIDVLRTLRPHYPELNLVHRLDRGTSGCLVVAKTRADLLMLNRAFADRACGKVYMALTAGHWAQARTIVRQALDVAHRAQGERSVRVDAERGQAAVSRFQEIERFPGSSLVRVEIDTGRTHQIRVHAAAAGHVLAGDDRYGNHDFNRQMARMGLRRMFLHAAELVLPLADGKPLRFKAPLPEDLARVLTALRAGDAAP
ncbi:MAG: RluA family pseudouridine synthase [Candidatus Macondimonas sp.]